MRSSGSADHLALDRDLPTSPADVAVLRKVRTPRPVSLEDYLGFLRHIQEADAQPRRSRRGPAGPPLDLTR